MSMRSLLPLLVLVAGAVQAQSVPTAPPAASDTWSRPAASSSAAASYGDSHGPLQAGEGSSGASHFKFKDHKSYQPERNAALEAAGKAGIGVGTQMDRNGRPAVSCAQTPMDPACR